ncbi:MAG: F0F1 ATP synthase subunit delta [Acidiferrobacteraceae bacterium]|nr:F0F1 ATP synthase subunit delta [Acidiferrobacteraceae bacterium]
MSENNNIARPYAQAIFEIAESSGNFSAWSEALGVMAMVAVNQDMASLLINPRVSRKDIGGVFIEVCGDQIDDLGQNLLRLLSQNRRLHILPEIAQRYELLRAEAERSVRAELESALPVSEEEQQQIAKALKARLGRDVDLVCKINEKLIGGAVIRAGDLVIDGSVRARLENLATAVGA